MDVFLTGASSMGCLGAQSRLPSSSLVKLSSLEPEDREVVFLYKYEIKIVIVIVLIGCQV